MTRTMVWNLPLLLVLAATSCENKALVDAFTTKSTTRLPTSSIPGKTILRSSTKAYLESLTKEEESSTEEKETPNKPLESTVAVNANGDTNKDPDIDSMMAEKTTDDESEEENLMQQIKDSGVAGVISYAAWELAFWTVSVPVCILGYKQVTGHWPDFNDKDDLSKLGAEAFAFVNFARFAVPLRIGLALGTTPWIQENIVDVFLSDKEGSDDKDDEIVAVAEEESQGDDDGDSDDNDEKDDEENTQKLGRFRIRSRVGNLINRVFKRNNQVQEEDKE